MDSTSIARPGQARAQDTLRWGGMVPVPITGAGLAQSLANASAHAGMQLVNAHWRWPLTWTVSLLVTPRGVTGDINVQFEINAGSGDAQQKILLTVNVPNGSVDTAITTIDVPASDILIRPVTITGTDTHPVAGTGSIEIAALAAPRTEAHALLEVLGCLCRLEERATGGSPADGRQGGWMPPGFYPEPLQYGR